MIFSNYCISEGNSIINCKSFGYLQNHYDRLYIPRCASDEVWPSKNLNISLLSTMKEIRLIRSESKIDSEIWTKNMDHELSQMKARKYCKEENKIVFCSSLAKNMCFLNGTVTV